jgi:ribonucleoside-diphosphate reductase alpha chain
MSNTPKDLFRSYDKDEITRSLKELCEIEPKLSIDCKLVVDKVVNGLNSDISMDAFIRYVAETAAYKSSVHYEYEELAGRISVYYLHSKTSNSFVEVVTKLYFNLHPKTRQNFPLVSEEFYNYVKANSYLDDIIDYKIDYTFKYFGFKTLEKSYLMKIDGEICERPQHMYLRVAVAIFMKNPHYIKPLYSLLSNGLISLATPTLFNAGTNKCQMSSCFLLTMEDDSIEGIYNTLKKCALISKSGGGIGLDVNCIRSLGSPIYGTNGVSNGLVPMLRVFNDTARYVDQGGGKRKGAFAIYVEPWHADIFDFLQLKRNNGKEENRSRDLFYGLWVPDLFMKRVENNEKWSLFCPTVCRDLSECYGEEFEAKYKEYEMKGFATKVVKATDLFLEIVDSQIETGTPYILYKDSCNRKSNQNNLGTIKCSNLCTEIIQYTSKDHVAVCNLASMSLPKYITQDKKFDHELLFKNTYFVAITLNTLIDRNYYPLPEAERSNMETRPISIGTQGLADVFAILKYPFDSYEARQLNREIFETIYCASITASIDLAKEHGCYPKYPGSPASKGQLQFDLWNVTPSARYDWVAIKEKLKEHGLRNSLSTGNMPTDSTSQILGNSQSFEPYTSNLFSRSVLAGSFTVVNRHMMKDLMELGLWDVQMKDLIIANDGSIQSIPNIPDYLKQVYKTVWEISQRSLIDMSADRGAFICQSQSFNVYMAKPAYGKIISFHFTAWKKGLKTGSYYLRIRPAAKSAQVTISRDIEKLQQSFVQNVKLEQNAIQVKEEKEDEKDDEYEKRDEKENGPVCTMQEGCFTCGT